MTHQRRPHVVAHLRALDEHFGTLEPSPAFEKRLQHRLQRATERTSSAPWLSVWLRRYARPTLVAIAATAVFVVSVSEKSPPDRAAIVTPYAPDASVDPIQTPMGEQLEQAIPHRDESPQTPLTSSPESPLPAPQEIRNEKRNVFPALPDPEFVPEKSLIQRRNVGPSIFPNTPVDRTHQRSEPFGFWSPAQSFPIDSQRPADGTSGEWSGGGSSSPKTSHTAVAPSASMECLAQEQLKKQAILDCEEMGQFLTNIVYLEPCKDGLFHRAEHECAENPADEETCTTDTITNGDICVDPGEFKMLALEKCKLANKDLVEFTYITDDCGWKTRKATYTCCPFPPDPQPPGPPPVCQIEALGDGSTCKDLSAIKEDAFLLCQSLGQTLADIQTAGNCPGGQASIAKIMCCSN